MDQETRAKFLREAANRERSDLVQLSIRELLEMWGYKRRGNWIVSQIEGELEDAGLITEPSFAQGWIDAIVQLMPIGLIELRHPRTQPEIELEERQEWAVESGVVTLLVSNLRSATQEVCSVPLDCALLTAQSLMIRHDYSQLAVMSDKRNLRGAITWEAIAQTSMRKNPETVRDCLIRAETVRHDDDLIHHIPRIVQAGYVFVRAKDETIGGIVTTADLSEEFARLATPFFLIGEIERRLRRSVNRAFSAAELGEVRDPGDEGRDVASADDLTMGEYVRLLEKADRWIKTGWRFERKVFIEALDAVRNLRNDVMHFSPDPLEEHELTELRRFIGLLKFVDPLE
jgi:predicted transcriptional regulator